MSDGWIGVDLDGTLAHYDPGHWKGHTHIGEPILPMVERVKRWLAAGYTVRVFTARVSAPDPKERHEARLAIRGWTLLHVGQELEATCTKDYAMIEFWDDRAVQVQINTGEPVGFSTRGLA